MVPQYNGVVSSTINLEGVHRTRRYPQNRCALSMLLSDVTSDAVDAAVFTVHQAGKNARDKFIASLT